VKIILCLVIFISACSSSSIRRTIAEDTSLQFSNIEVRGASNSAGSGATLPLLARIRDHLVISFEDKKLIDNATMMRLSKSRILIAADYFFPTNFPQIKKDSKTVKIETEKMIKSWLSNFDLVMIGLLPTWGDLDPDIKQFVIETDYGGYKNILDILDQYRTNISVINSVIKGFAKNSSKIKMLKLDKMIVVSKDQFDGKQMLYSFPIPAGPFNSDKLHFSDAGQAFFLNTVILPELSDKIPPIMSTGKVSKLQMVRALKTILNSKDRFLNGEDGGYWVEFINPKQFLSENADIRGASTETMKPIMKIIAVINENAYSRPGFPIYIQRTQDNHIISLDLSSALFYTKIDLKEIANGIYEGWGYDYWMSAGLLNPPRVNYKFKLSSSGAPDTFVLEWTLLPLTKDQPKDLARLNFLNESIIKDIKNSPSFVTYKIEIQVKDL
jgi:hypothetical protein